ncbi:MAG: hypothetical protein KDD64_11060 [Bdellovibrionales bacterium]|nr:hypothetical protein [Bdellovibrionales bacterium]
MTPSLSHLAALQRVSREAFHTLLSTPISREQKDDGSWVTSADVGIETLLREWIRKNFPDHSIRGEEFADESGSSPYTWILDPIDGTEDFSRGIGTFGTVVGILHDGKSVGGFFDFPSLDFSVVSFEGEGIQEHSRDQRDHPLRDAPLICLAPLEAFQRSGEEEISFELQRAFPKHRILYTCYSMALAATGRVSATVEWNLSLWDYSPIESMCVESKKAFEWIRKTGSPKSECFVAGNSQVVEQISTLLR